MKHFASRCQEHTALTGMQAELLKRIAVCFPLLADLVRACVRFYVPTKDGQGFLLLAVEMPCTVYLPSEGTAEGTIAGRQEEPLVQQVFSKGKPVRGKREWSYGHMRDLCAFPVLDGGKVLAAVELESDLGQLRIEEQEHLVKTAGILLEHARKPLEPERYRHMSSSDGILVADRFRRIIYADAAAVRIYRVLGVGSLVGCHLLDRQLLRHVTKETVVSSRPWEKELEAGGLILLQRSIPILEGGTLVRQMVVLSDVTALRQKDQEIRIKSAVIQEIHHRVKNNLQMAASLLRLQARRSPLPEVKSALQESVDRLLSLSVVHEFLSQQGKEEIDVAVVMQSIFDLVAGSMKDKEFSLRTEFRGTHLTLPSRYASSLALVLNELVLNAMEHAFEGRREGVVGLAVEEGEGQYFLDVYDDGNGLPEGFELQSCHSLGLQIVQTLVEGDLGGTIVLASENGTHARLAIPREGGK